MAEKSNEQISVFIRDEKTGRLVFNGKALQALGIDPAKASERGYPIGAIVFPAVSQPFGAAK